MAQQQFWLLTDSKSTLKLAVWADEMDLETVICPADEMHQHPGKRLTDLSVTLPTGFVQDFVWTWPSEGLIQERVLDLFRSEHLTGFEAIPAKARFKRRSARQPPRLWELVVTGWAGMAPADSGVHVVEHCPVCGHKTYMAPTDPGKLIRPEQWDGSDFFIVWPLPKFIFVTNRVAVLIRDHKLTGAVLKRPEDLDFSGGGCSAGRLSYWMPEARARKLGEEAGLDEI
jgi:hypothetical protein